ncbi:MAG: sigma-70 family RNA polymerase sigma factor [Clostridia bacterium]|nr:sigma-70 family RNA polymerase sigma factor [Clostridia bacterium]MBQ8334455.1 sigma-70 family RNA polymerase sigma factor [Clostridia bacterium]
MFFTLLSAEQTAETPLTPDEHDLIAGLYDAYAPRVRFLAAQILKNDMDADDALVEVFIRIMRYKNKFVGIDEKQICRLIVLFTRSTCIDLYRRRERYQSVHVAITAVDEDGELYDMEFPDDSDVLSDIVSRETVEHLREALRSLNSPAKEIILMKYYGGMKNREIADFFGMKLPTVAVMIHRAMLKMRKQLEGYVNEASQNT